MSSLHFEHEFINNFGGSEHQRYLLRSIQTDIVKKQIEYITKGEYKLNEIEDLFGYTPKSIIIKRQTLQIQQYVEDGVLFKQESRNVSWQELLFDLFFVAAFHSMGKGVEYNPTLLQLRFYATRFTLLWIVWGKSVFVTNYFLKNDVFERLFLTAMSAIVLGMGLNSVHEFKIDFLAFFMLGRLLTICCKLPFVLKPNEFRSYFALKIFLSIIPCSLLFGSIILNNDNIPLITVFVCVELLFYVLFKVVIRYGLKLSKYPVPNIHHAKERMGLLTIVVLGEFTYPLLIDSNSLSALLIAVFGLFIVSKIQYIYFKKEHDGSHIEQLNGKNAVLFPLWFFIHLPMQCAIALGGVGLSMIVHNTARIDAPKRSFNIKSPGIDLDYSFEYAKMVYFACLSIVMLSLASATVIHDCICRNRMEWRRVFSLLFLFTLFLILCVLCAVIYLDVFFVTTLSAFAMLLITSKDEVQEVKAIWRKRFPGPVHLPSRAMTENSLNTTQSSQHFTEDNTTSFK
eukprot:NODE_31_length_37178_cov_0.413576.p5 type:complete len:512 gc:universal NODE_31_length_37178_cov_0.413576:2983-4518(+)